jgi:hypothetical protein
MGPLDIPDQPYDLGGSSQQFDTRPILLLSTERSGSNLLRSILNTHPDITAPHPLETAFPWRNITSPGRLSADQRWRLVRDILVNKHHSHHPLVDELDIDAVVERIERADAKSFLTVQEALYDTYAETTGASAWVSKDPSIWDYLEELREYYDDLSVVYLVRDARDVALSFKCSNVGRFHPYFNAQRWAAEQDVGLSLLDGEFGDSMYLVRYQDLLEEPESTTAELCEFLGVQYAPEMLYYYDTTDAKQASKSAGAFENLSVPIKSDNYGKFHDGLTDKEIAITETIAGEQLQAFEYTLTTPQDDLAAVELEPDRYEQVDRRLARSSWFERIRENLAETLRRYATRSFSVYMILRYGLMA